MLPTMQKVATLENITVKSQPSLTYKMLIEDERIVGDIDELEAIQQACYKILNTERYQHIIYSWGYGAELQSLFGKPIPYIYSELPRRIKEALLYDDRIEDVRDFELSHEQNNVLCKFTVYTAAGILEMSKGVVTSV